MLLSIRVNYAQVRIEQLHMHEFVRSKDVRGRCTSITKSPRVAGPYTTFFPTAKDLPFARKAAHQLRAAGEN